MEKELEKIFDNAKNGDKDAMKFLRNYFKELIEKVEKIENDPHSIEWMSKRQKKLMYDFKKNAEKFIRLTEEKE